MADRPDIALRLAAATTAGALIGFERSRRNRAIMGVRTMSLVGAGFALVVLVGIVLIRTFFGFPLDVAIGGRWPWQRRDARRAEPAPAAGGRHDPAG